MTAQNLVGNHLSDEQWTAVDAAIDGLQAAMEPVLVALGVARRARLVKMGDGSEAFVRKWAPGDPARALRRLQREFGGSPVVTLGARGGIYWHDGRVKRFRSPRVRVRDTTGAGDVFHGAFAAGLAHGLELPEIVSRAALAGAIACTALGATARLASWREWATARVRSR